MFKFVCSYYGALLVVCVLLVVLAMFDLPLVIGSLGAGSAAAFSPFVWILAFAIGIVSNNRWWGVLLALLAGLLMEAVAAQTSAGRFAGEPAIIPMLALGDGLAIALLALFAVFVIHRDRANASQ